MLNCDMDSELCPRCKHSSRVFPLPSPHQATFNPLASSGGARESQAFLNLLSYLKSSKGQQQQQQEVQVKIEEGCEVPQSGEGESNHDPH